jgi:hypothetical protein
MPKGEEIDMKIKFDEFHCKKEKYVSIIDPYIQEEKSIMMHI